MIKFFKEAPWHVKASIIWLLMVYGLLLVTNPAETIMISGSILSVLAVTTIIAHYFG